MKLNSRFARRAFLKGLGLSAAASPFLPLLNVSGQELGPPPKRLILFFTPHGTIYDQWRPTNVVSETQFTLGPILQPLAPYQSKLVVLGGMKLVRRHFFSPHPQGVAELWTGSGINRVPLREDGGGTPAGVWSTGTSVDQLILQGLRARGQPLRTRYQSLELGVHCDVGGARCSSRTIYTSASNYLNPQTDPAAVFRSIFSGVGTTTSELERVQFEKRSVIDLHKAEIETVLRGASVHDRPKIAAHLAALRDLEQTLVPLPAREAVSGGHLRFETGWNGIR